MALGNDSHRSQNILIRIADIAAGFIMAVPLILFMLMKSITGRKHSAPEIKKILILDMSYTIEMVRKRYLDQPILARDLSGYFDHVFSINPCATIIPPENGHETYGKISITSFAPRHTIIEGKVGRFNALRHFPKLNFILSQWHLLLYLNNLINNEKISVLRAGDPYYLGLIGLGLSRANGIPCVFRIPINYDLFYRLNGDLAFPRLFQKRWIEKIVDHFTLKRADLVAGANQDGLNYAIDNGVKEEFSTLLRVGNLIHPSHRVSPQMRPDAGDILKDLGLVNKNFSITISRTEPLKQVDDVIRACGEVKRRGFDFSALIIGDGSMSERLKVFSEEMGLIDDVVFAGNKDQEWISSVLPKAKVVISPFMGRGLTEAAMSGVPIVAYDIEWQSEIIMTGVTGELVEYRNWRAIADSVVRYLENPAYAKRMGENARATILEMMDPVKLTEHEINQYEKLFRRYFNTKGSLLPVKDREDAAEL